MREPDEERPEIAPHAKVRRSRSAWMYRWPLLVYAAILLCSWSFERWSGHEPRHAVDPALRTIEIGVPMGDGTVRRETLHLAYREWSGPNVNPAHAAVILVHGSPGSGDAFETTAAPLAAMGYRVIAPDLPGFGGSQPDPLGIGADRHALAVLEMMNSLNIDRAHVGGWSLGGAVVLNLVDRAPARVASLTLLASVSDQSAEGSGSYIFEHMKYAAGYAAATLARHGLPHFGTLGELDNMRASMRNFWDTDMRPHAAIMDRLRAPTLILHGKDDPLVPLWAARHSHDVIRRSTLIVTPYSHFMPFMQGEETGRTLGTFFAQHDDPNGPIAGRSEEVRTTLPAPLFGRAGSRAWEMVRAAPFWVVLCGVVALAFWRPRFGASLAFLFVAFGVIDIGYAAMGVPIAWLARASRSFVRGRLAARSGAMRFGKGIHARSPRLWTLELERRPVRRGLGAAFVPGALDSLWHALGGLGGFRAIPLAFSVVSCLTMTFLLVLAMFMGSMWILDPLVAHLGAPGVILAGAMLAWLTWVIALLLSPTGWRVLRMRFARTIHKEYWPTLVLYLLLAPEFVRSGLRHGPSAFTACNPTIPGGGGMIGESKTQLLHGLNDPSALAAILVPANADAEARASAALAAIETRQELGGFPVILKPDRGLRGHAVRLARTPEDVRAYFRETRSDAIVQRFHPGPCECGILWVKDASAIGDATRPAGFIAGITRKEFPILIGDGRRTLERLVWRHPRFHRQAPAFLERFADDRDRVLGKGERVRLAQSGNHCQGTLFRDGADLISPELSQAIDRVARHFALDNRTAKGESELDMARFDIRYESDDALRRGEGWAIVEINGTAGEATNIYDPDRSFAWMWSTLAQQWRWLYELGARRRRQGVKGMSLLALIVRARRFFNGVSGSSVAD
jgi:pimeloyl-ACP methyl ester carboxylesterase